MLQSLRALLHRLLDLHFRDWGGGILRHQHSAATDVLSALGEDNETEPAPKRKNAKMTAAEKASSRNAAATRRLKLGSLNVGDPSSSPLSHGYKSRSLRPPEDYCLIERLYTGYGTS